MTKKQKNDFFWVFEGIGVLFGFYLWYKFSLNIIWLLASFIVPSILSWIITSLIPTNNKKNTKKRKSPSTPKINKTEINKDLPKNKTVKNPYGIMPLENLLIAELNSMSGYDFEELCFQYFKHTYNYVEQTSYAKDKGVDFIFKDIDGFRVAVQVKHRCESNKKITLSEINQLNGARRAHNCSRGCFITSTGYTKDAINHADDLHIKTFDGTWVENKILRWREKEAKKRNLA